MQRTSRNQSKPYGKRTHGKRSGFESRVYSNALRQGHRLVYEPKEGKLPYVLYYLPDFILPNGIIVEAKGWFTPSDRTKMLRVKKSNPQLDIRFVFQRNNTLGNGSKTTYLAWARRHGFKAIVGEEIPSDWFEEKKRL